MQIATQLSHTALAEVGPEDSEENISFLDTAQAKVNVANDENVRAQVDQVWDIIRRIKSRRLELEDEWLAIQRMVVLDHDEGKKYNGRSNAYLPVYARARKVIVSALMKGVFPSDEYLDVVDRENGESEEAKAIKAVVQYELECSANIRAVFKPFLGQFVDFGWAVMKRWYRTNKIVKPKRSRTPKNTIPPMDVTYDEGFTLSNRSVFNVVVYPEWAESKRDLQIEAERLDIPDSVAMLHFNSKRWLNGEEAMSTGSNNDGFDWANQQTLFDVSNISGVQEFRGKTGSPVESVIAVEAWCRLVLPKAQYHPDEDSTQPIPARVLFINGVGVLVRRNNFTDQQSPYEYARDNIVAGNFYGSGAGRLTRSLQYLSNDFANQTNDVGIYGLNPVALVNPNYFAGPVDSFRPGRVYKVRDVEAAVKFVSPKVEIVQYGQTLLQQTVTMAQDGSGAPPVLQGSKAASTATGTQQLSANANSPLQDTVEDLEVQVMVPLMHAAWELAKQYRNKPFLRKFLSPPPIDPLTGQPAMDPVTQQPMQPEMKTVSILPSDINIDVEMRFLSSAQAVNRQARQQGLMTFTQLLTPLLPLLQAQGKMVDPTPILQRSWTDGLGNRGFDKLIIPIPMQGQPSPSGPPSQGQVPPPNQPPVSVVPQGNVTDGSTIEPQPGEGDTVMPMRNMIEQETGPQGMMGPQGPTPY